MNICPTGALFRRRDGIVDLNGDVVHRLPRVHGGVPVRSAVHRSEHAHGREVQLLREPGREQAAAGVRERLPDRVPHLRRPGRSDERSRADRAARSVHGPQARERHGAEDLLSRRGRERRSGRRSRRGRSCSRKARCTCGRSARRSRIRARPGDPRVDYDVPHKQAVGHSTWCCTCCSRASRRARCSCRRCSGCWAIGRRSSASAARSISLVFFAIATAVVLVIDLERPERFYYILTRPNWRRGWRGARFCSPATARSPGCGCCAYWLGWTTARSRWLAPLAIAVAFGATGYTGFLFAQGLARDLWQGPHATIDLHRAGGGRRQRGDAARRDRRRRRRRRRIRALGADAGVLRRSRTWRSCARARAHAEPDAPSRARGARDPPRRLRAAVLGRRASACGGARAARCSSLSASIASCSLRHARRRVARARRQPRVGVHLGGGRTERCRTHEVRIGQLGYSDFEFRHLMTEFRITSRPVRSGTTTSTSSPRAGRRRIGGTTGSFRASASTASRRAASSPTSTRRRSTSARSRATRCIPAAAAARAPRASSRPTSSRIPIAFCIR